MEKYYTPDESEFHFGFEYEQNYFIPVVSPDRGWEKQVYHGQLLSNPRVKYLDREDFESVLGGNAGESDERIILDGPRECNRGEQAVCFLYNKVSHWLLVTIDGKTVFAGTIKNKSELKRLMIQLGIT